MARLAQFRSPRKTAACSSAPMLFFAWLGFSTPGWADPPALPSAWIDAYLAGSRALEVGELDAARAELERAIAILPRNDATRYQLACLCAREGRVEEAFELLTSAMRDGFDDVLLLEWDSDLAPLRTDRRYARLRSEIEAVAEDSARASLTSELASRRSGTQFVADEELQTIVVGSGAAGESIDVRTRETLAILTRPGERSSNVAASADGRFVAVSGDLADSVPIRRTNFLRVHDAATGDLLRELEPAGWEATVWFDPDSACLRSWGSGADANSKSIAYDTTTWTPTDRPSPPPSSRPIVEFDADELRVFDPDRGTLRMIGAATIEFQERGSVYGIPVVAGGSLLVGTTDGTVMVLDSDSRDIRFQIPTPSVATLLPVWAPDPSRSAGCWLAAGDGSLREIDVSTGRTTRTFRPGSSRIVAISISRDGALLACLDARGVFRLVATSDGTVVAERSGIVDAETSGGDFQPGVEFSPDGSRCAVTDRHDALVLIDVRSGALVADLTGLGRLPDLVWSRPIAWSNDGRRLAILGDGNRVRVIAAADGSDAGLEWTIDRPVASLSFDPAGKRLWIGTAKPGFERRESERAQVVVVDLESTSGSVVRTIDFGALDDLGTMGVGCIAVGDDVAVVASSGFGIVAAYETLSGKRLWKHEYLAGNAAPIHCAFDATRERVIVSRQGQWTPSVFDPRTGERLLDLTRHDLWAIDWIDGSDRIVASGRRGLESRDNRSGDLRWSRVETLEGGYLLRSPGGHVDGTADALRRLHLALPERSWPLDALASWLLDAKKVRAAAAGVAVTPPRRAAMPSLAWAAPTPRSRTWSAGDPAPRVTLEAVCPDGIAGFEVRIDGRVEFREGDAADSTRRTIEIEIPAPREGQSVDLRVRAIATSGAMSRALYRETMGSDPSHR